jgi:hypothetical protein
LSISEEKNFLFFLWTSLPHMSVVANAESAPVLPKDRHSASGELPDL